jgi:cytochrome o ubiquinol oxidase operon protein cyoD
MSDHGVREGDVHDVAPGDEEFGEHDVGSGVRGYLIGLGLATLLTIGSFLVARDIGGEIYTPGIPMALAALAVAQMGVHLAFFLHITTGPDNTNNALALAFGALIVGLVIGGSLWIMYHLNANMVMPADMMDMHTQK